MHAPPRTTDSCRVQADEWIGVAVERAVVPPGGEQQNSQLQRTEHDAQRHGADRAGGERLAGRGGQ
ncbi:hypothetical protein GCM10027028_14350 [Streptomyces sundarbansensis]